jgi:2,3-bisphosphoglycerate-dependent phosphoglycerate mutase
MITTIYMVRHADSPFVFGDERNRGLSDEGVGAARRVADILADVTIDFIASSSYARAIQTVQYLAEAKGLPITEYEELAERAIKGLDYEAPWELLEAAIEQSFSDNDYALEGGESTRKVQQRAIPVIEKMLQEYEGKTSVIGTHGNIMTIIMNFYDDRYGYDFWRGTSKPDIYKLTFTANRLEKAERIWERDV